MRAALAVVCLTLATVAHAQNQSPATYVEGKDYFRLKQPVKVADESKTEVAFFFNYVSGHAQSFDRVVEDLRARLPGEVYIRRVPGTQGASSGRFVAGYFAAVRLNVEAQAHEAMLEVGRTNPNALPRDEDWAEFLAGFGVDKATALSAYKSFSVQAKVRESSLLADQARIEVTPALLVCGQFRVDVGQSHTHQQIMEVAQWLVSRCPSPR